MHSKGCFAAVTLALAALACQSKAPPPQQPERVTGTVSYRDRMAMPPAALVRVSLLDVSKRDAPATLIARRTIRPEGEVPVPFVLEYDPSQIDDSHVYAVRATIEQAGEALFVTNRLYRVITGGAPTHVDLMLVRSTRGG